MAACSCGDTGSAALQGGLLQGLEQWTDECVCVCVCVCVYGGGGGGASTGGPPCVCRSPGGSIQIAISSAEPCHPSTASLHQWGTMRSSSARMHWKGRGPERGSQKRFGRLTKSFEAGTFSCKYRWGVSWGQRKSSGVAGSAHGRGDASPPSNASLPCGLRSLRAPMLCTLPGSASDAPPPKNRAAPCCTHCGRVGSWSSMSPAPSQMHVTTHETLAPLRAQPL